MPEPYLAVAPYFGWDLVRDVQELLRYAFMQHAYEAGTIVALSAGVIGYFVVLRGLSFAAHALSHIGFAGATGAVLLGAAPIVGLLAFTMSAGAVMGALGQRLRGRDVTIGLVMAWSLGLGLLFTALYKGSASLAIGILFGQIFGITSGEVVVTFVAGSLTVLALSSPPAATMPSSRAPISASARCCKTLTTREKTSAARCTSTKAG